MTELNHNELATIIMGFLVIVVGVSFRYVQSQSLSLRERLNISDVTSKNRHDELEAQLRDFQEHYRSEHKLLESHIEALTNQIVDRERHDKAHIYERIDFNGNRISKLEAEMNATAKTMTAVQSSLERVRSHYAAKDGS